MNTNTKEKDSTFTNEDMYNLVLGAWEKQLDQLPENESQFREYVDIFLKATGYSKKAPLISLYRHSKKFLIRKSGNSLIRK